MMKRPAPWAITFADLLTQCLCFMAIWPVMASAAMPIEAGHEPLESRSERETPVLVASLFPDPAAREATANDDAGRRAVRIPLTELFEPGSAALRAGHETRIEEAARVAAYAVSPSPTQMLLVRAQAPADVSDGLSLSRAVPLALALERAAAAAGAIARSSGLPRSRFSLAGTTGDEDGATLVISFLEEEFGGAAQNAERGDGRLSDSERMATNDERADRE